MTGADGRERPLRCSVDYISFSAHADGLQTSQFIDALAPPIIVLVHGDGKQMLSLKKTPKFRSCHNDGSAPGDRFDETKSVGELFNAMASSDSFLHAQLDIKAS